MRVRCHEGALIFDECPCCRLAGYPNGRFYAAGTAYGDHDPVNHDAAFVLLFDAVVQSLNAGMEMSDLMGAG